MLRYLQHRRDASASREHANVRHLASLDARERKEERRRILHYTTARPQSNDGVLNEEYNRYTRSRMFLGEHRNIAKRAAVQQYRSDLWRKMWLPSQLCR